MIRGVRNFILALFALIIITSLVLSGCTRYANEEQLNALDESSTAVSSLEKQIAEKEQEKTELQRKLAEKQDELRNVQAEKEKVRSKL